jgi:signal transduction histidine kinase
MTGNFDEVLDPARLAALRRLGLLDSPAEAAFDQLGALAAKLLHSPIALVSLVDDRRQFFKSCQGLREPWASWRDTPLSHSFCQHVLTTDEPLIIDDARFDPRFIGNPAIEDLGMVAYLGIPLKLNSGEVLGSFCVIDHEPRRWTAEEVEIMSTLAASVMTEIELRSEIRHKDSAFEEVERLNQQLREKTASLETAKGELEAFSHSVLHDLQAPLRSLDSFTGLLRDRFQTEMSQVGQSYLQGIVEATGRMQKILAGLQTLARLAKARMEISETDLTATAKNVLAELQRSAPERNAVVDIEDGLKASADSRLIQIAFENLLGNAWKFTSKTPNARIEMGASTEGDERVYWVRDNGAGFDEAQLAKLFVPFKRLHSQQEFPGTGIGLATVKRIIQRHQGRVWAESEPGKGATFYFTLGNPDRPIGGS